MRSIVQAPLGPSSGSSRSFRFVETFEHIAQDVSTHMRSKPLLEENGKKDKKGTGVVFMALEPSFADGREGERRKKKGDGSHNL
jgi:hypothetical protein